MKNNVSFDDKLLSACESADIEEVKELLQNGADVNAKNANINLKHNWDEGPDDNSTILACCCYCDEGFPSEEYVYRISLSALMKASENGHLEVVEFLIKKGAKVNQINRENRTPLHFAAENGHLEVVTILQSFVDGKDCKNSNFENSSKKKINNSCLPSLQSSTNSNGMRL